MRSTSAMVRSVVHARQLRPRDEQAPRPAAGGQQQRVVGHHLAVIQAHVALVAARCRRRAGPGGWSRGGRRRTGAGRISSRSRSRRAGQVLLRQRRALVGQPGLLADQREPPGEALAAQGVDGLHRAPDRRPRSQSARTSARRIADAGAGLSAPVSGGHRAAARQRGAADQPRRRNRAGRRAVFADSTRGMKTAKSLARDALLTLRRVP